MDQNGENNQGASTDAINLPLAARAFWQTLAADGPPALKAISNAGLAPFRDISLLVEISDNSAVIRHIGQRLGLALGLGAAQKGQSLQGHSPLADAMTVPLLLAAQNESASDALKLFGFDGVCIPFRGPKGDVDFVLGVFVPNDPKGAANNIDQAIKEGRAMVRSGAATVRTREGLYGILACAMDIRRASLMDMGAFQERLRQEGLGGQVRAPFTPILKLLLGGNYDKTRLAEYATALQFAERHGLEGGSLRGFFQNIPGGIKGCVHAERSIRKSQKGLLPDPILSQALIWLDAQPVLGHVSAQTDEDYVVFLARRGGEEGHYEVVSLVDMTDGEKRRYLKKAAKGPINKTPAE